MNRILVCTAVALVYVAGAFRVFADGASPSGQTLNVQGILRTVAGDLQSTAVGLVVNLYASKDATSAFYTQSFTTVPVENGFFSVELSGMSLSFDTADAWVGIQVAGDAAEMPRQHLTAVPYAFNAVNATGDITPKSVTVGGVKVIDASGNWVGPSSGVAGPQGPAGVPCSGCVDDPSIKPGALAHSHTLTATIVTSAALSLGAGSTGYQTASCGDGVMTGGGCQTPAGVSTVHLINSFPANSTTWGCYAFNGDSAGHNMYAYAICLTESTWAHP